MPTSQNSDTFLYTLVALRDRYLALVTTTGQSTHHAREQLNHINALLVDQAISAGLAIAPAAPLPPLVNAASTSTPVKETPTPAAAKRQPKSAAAAETNATAAPAPKLATPPASIGEKSQRETVLALLPAFAGLSKTEAVAQVMADHAGQPLSLDQIIEQLHGELDQSDLRQERKRMRTILWRGVDSKRWARAKGKASHYTLTAKGSPVSNGKAPGKTKPAATTTKTTMASKAVRGKGAIAGSLMGAVEQVLQDNRGVPMRAEAIATTIYGALPPARLAEVKKDIADRLAKGAKAKRWQRVPQQLGVYVMP